VATNPTRDHPGPLSPVAASTLAGRLLGPAAATAAWTLTSPTTATARIGGRRYVLVDETDPHGWVTSLRLYQVTPCDGDGDGEQAVPARPGATASPPRPATSRRHTALAGEPTRLGSRDAPPRPTRKDCNP